LAWLLVLSGCQKPVAKQRPEKIIVGTQRAEPLSRVGPFRIGGNFENGYDESITTIKGRFYYVELKKRF
jgi:hypothetical protein